ncbi:MAG TPA: glycosyltransferase family 4 protein [Sphingobium sp.]
MRILSILTSFTSGGAEVLVTNLSRAFSRAGHASTVATLCEARTLGNSAEVEWSQRTQIEESGGFARSLHLSGRRPALAGALALIRLLRELQPDVIHAHTARAMPMLWLARPGCPIILTHHNSRLSFPIALFRLFDRSVSEYVAISEDCGNILAPHTRHPITTIRNGVGAEYMADSPRQLPQDHVEIIAVGAISAQKDYPTLIRAAPHLRSRLHARGLTARIRIAGDGAMMPDLKTLIEAEDVSDMVELLGTRSDIHHLLSAADLFVNSSLYEGLSIAQLEGMATGLPVVATQVAGNRELIQHGVNGLLARGGDPESLAAQIDEALLDPEFYETLSRGAIATARNHSMEACAEDYLRVYERVVGNRTSVRSPVVMPVRLTSHP